MQSAKIQKSKLNDWSRYFHDVMWIVYGHVEVSLIENIIHLYLHFMCLIFHCGIFPMITSVDKLYKLTET